MATCVGGVDRGYILRRSINHHRRELSALRSCNGTIIIATSKICCFRSLDIRCVMCMHIVTNVRLSCCVNLTSLYFNSMFIAEVS